MSETTTVKLMTSDDLFALPYSKKVDRWLFRGELRESKVTKRNPSHSRTTATVSAVLYIWARTLPPPRPVVYSNEAYFRIRRDPETNVGVDVASSRLRLLSGSRRARCFMTRFPHDPIRGPSC